MQLRHAGREDLEAVLALETMNFSQEEQIAKEVLQDYVTLHHRTCLVMETAEGQLAGYILSVPTEAPRVTDQIFSEENRSLSGPYLAVASLSVSPDFKGQGIGTLLLAGLKEVASQGNAKGICLTCKEYLLSYYEFNGFEDCGESASQFAGQTWYDMYWERL